jgi:hypothetical protein
MAIDTAEKRRSLSGIQWSMMPGVTMNAAKDREWRQESGWGYPGIVPVGEAPVVSSETRPEIGRANLHPTSRIKRAI